MTRTGLIRSVWGHLPENALKGHARVLFHNAKADPRFRLRGGVYSAAVGGEVVRTTEHPFDIPGEVAAYEDEYSPGPGDVVVDAGSFNGHLAAYWALRVGPSGRVVTVEPDPANAEVVRNVLRINGVEGRVTVVTQGLWDAPGDLPFHAGVGVASSPFWANPGSHPLVIEVVTLDDLVGRLGLGRLDLVKMDIEGCEVRALLGARGVLRRFGPRLAVAAGHTVKGRATLPDVLELLEGLDYSTRVIHSDEPIVHAAPRSRPR